MARYGNLKDYFIGEHIELIKGAIIEHLEHELNNGFYINNPIVNFFIYITSYPLYHLYG